LKRKLTNATLSTTKKDVEEMPIDLTLKQHVKLVDVKRKTKKKKKQRKEKIHLME